jgi:hypothetical protein
MAIVRPAAIQSHMSRVVASLDIAVTVRPALADPAPVGGDRGVRTGGNSYQPYAVAPGTSGTASRGDTTAHGRSANSAHAGDGCVVQGAQVLCPRCADPEGTGICDAPHASISPAELARRAWKSLGLPIPAVHTAPPRGSKGLVGLPEWVGCSSG